MADTVLTSLLSIALDGRGGSFVVIGWHGSRSFGANGPRVLHSNTWGLFLCFLFLYISAWGNDSAPFHLLSFRLPSFHPVTFECGSQKEDEHSCCSYCASLLLWGPAGLYTHRHTHTHRQTTKPPSHLPVLEVPRLGQRVVVEELRDEVHMRQEHAAAAVALQAHFVQRHAVWDVCVWFRDTYWMREGGGRRAWMGSWDKGGGTCGWWWFALFCWFVVGLVARLGGWWRDAKPPTMQRDVWRFLLVNHTQARTPPCSRS
jgi:hypothetical protein